MIISCSTKRVTRSSIRNICDILVFVSQIELKAIQEALVDYYWVMVMHEEVSQFKRNNVYTLVLKPSDHSIIGTRWVSRNKLEKNGIIIRNKVRLVVK